MDLDENNVTYEFEVEFCNKFSICIIKAWKYKICKNWLTEKIIAAGV